MKSAKLPKIDPELLTTALTHRSYLNEHPKEKIVSNERLEFLGDAVLELIISQFLYQKFKKEEEGMLTTLRASLVKTSTLTQIAQKFNLGEKLRLSKGEEQSGGRQNATLLANTFEAVVGALYLDRGLKVAHRFIIRHLAPLLEEIISRQLYKDYKSLLQETVQAQSMPTPTYQVIKAIGPDHNKTFTVAVLINNQPFSHGSGKSKQQAQENAAQKALIKLAKS